MNKTLIWKQASEVFADISELSPQQALVHLHGIQNLTAEVREAVITLINAGSQASQYFADNISPNYNINFNTIQNFQSGQILDEYTLLEKLGYGGMSQVFKARRTNTKQQTYVAIKIFAPRNNSEELLNHFINEQKILSELSHPSIVKMLHGGMTDDKTAYLVMELIEEAQPLDEYCKKNKLGIRKKIKLISQCADALAYSHANLIIHRDLKPDNILINQRSELKIVDFGIAKLINNDISGNKTTIMALTPSYAAPEQINSEQITVKTDIFSLAVVALDLLSNKKPLPKDRLLKSCVNDEAYIDNVLRKLNVDKDLKNILRKSLEQAPNNRYSSMQSFADDLNNFLAYKPVNATSQSIVYRIQKFAKRRSALFATMVSFFAFLIIGSSLGYQQYKQIKIEVQKANQVKQFMLDSFEITDPDNAQGVDISSKDLLKLSSDKLKNNNSIDSNIKFELLQTLGLAYGKLGSYNQAIELIQQSLLIKPNNAKSLSFHAQYLFNSKNNKELNLLLETINLNNFGSYSDKAIIYRININKLMTKSDFKNAHKLIKKLKKLNTNPRNSREYVLTQRLLAKLFYYESNYSDSIKVLSELLENKNLIIKQTQLMGIRNNLAGLYSEIGEYKLSIKQWTEIIEQQKHILGSKHPELAESLIGLSVSYMRIGEIKKSSELLDEAYTISVGLFGVNNLTTANILNSQAMIQKSKGENQKAIKTLTKVVGIYENQLSANHADTNILKTSLAQLLNEQGRNKEAYDIAKEVYAYQIKTLGTSHTDTLYSQQIIAYILFDLGKKDEAIDLAKKAVQVSKPFIEKGIKHTDYVSTYYVLAQIYQKNKQYKDAMTLFHEIINKDFFNEKEIKHARIISSLAELFKKTDDSENANRYYQDAIIKYEGIYSSTHNETLLLRLRYAKFLKQNNQLKASLNEIVSVKNLVKENNITDEILHEKINSL